MPGQLLSINTLRAGRGNFCVFIKLATMKRTATMKTTAENFVAGRMQ
jgi:hypothetical protein